MGFCGGGRRGDLEFGGNPVTKVLSGPLGTGDLGFLSAFRDTPPKIPSQLAVGPILVFQLKRR